MDRAKLFELARKHGYRDGTEADAGGRRVPLSGSALEALREELVRYFDSPEGRGYLEACPPWLRGKPLGEIVDLILREVM